MRIRVDAELCTGCYECHHWLRHPKALADGLPGMPDIAYGSGYRINDKFAEMFDWQLQQAYEHCKSGALSIEE